MQRRHRRENHDGAVEAAGRRRWCGREGLSNEDALAETRSGHLPGFGPNFLIF
jgi:hypothetical protein